MPGSRVLLVDDNETVRTTLQESLMIHGFEVITAAGVNEALQCIAANKFDVLISDLHMPDRGDGLTVVSAMRNAHPEAVTLVYSGYPEMEEATNAILLQADQILLKPLNIQDLVAVIRQNLARDLVVRLRRPTSVDGKHIDSIAAHEHGQLRRQQGYSAPLLVEESRILQVSIFQTLQSNLARVDFSLLLVDVMTIADEVDSQLCQAMQAFTPEQAREIRVA